MIDDFLNLHKDGYADAVLYLSKSGGRIGKNNLSNWRCRLRS